MVQKVELSDEQRKEQQRVNCLDETKLRLMLAKCTDLKHCQEASTLTHKLLETKAKDFLPTGKVCKLTGSKGALLLESERGEYEKIYCKIDPAHKICTATQENDDEEDDDDDEAPVLKESVASTTQSSSENGSAGLILLSSSSCCCLLMMIGAMVMMRR
jgi:hypothetical protein